MKLRFIFYALIAIILQVLLGLLTSLGQGSIGLLIFIILVEIDPNFSFAYIQSNIREIKETNNDKNGGDKL